MEKVLLLLNSLPDDKKAWSGTNYNIAKTLSVFFDIDYFYLDYSVRVFERFLDVYFKFLKKFFKIKRRVKPTCYLKLYSKKIINKIKIINAKYVFTTDCHIVPFLGKYRDIVIYISDATFYSMVGYYWNDYNKHDYKLFEKLQAKTIKYSCLNIFSSDWAVESAVEHYKCDVKKVFCVPFGANLPECNPIIKHLNTDKIHILFCGVDKIRKGLSLAIRTIKELNKRHPGRFVLDVLGIDGNSDEVIIYHGKKDKNLNADLEYIQNIYTSSKLLLLPTLAECSAIVFCEAAMYSLPVISHKTGGTSNYIKDGFNGFLLAIGSLETDFADKIEIVTKNEVSYTYFSNNSRILYDKKLNWRKWGEHVFSLVNKRNN